MVEGLRVHSLGRQPQILMGNHLVCLAGMGHARHALGCTRRLAHPFWNGAAPGGRHAHGSHHAKENGHGSECVVGDVAGRIVAWCTSQFPSLGRHQWHRAGAMGADLEAGQWSNQPLDPSGRLGHHLPCGRVFKNLVQGRKPFGLE